MDWFARRPRTPPQALQPPPQSAAASAAARKKRAAAASRPPSKPAGTATPKPRRGPAAKKPLPPCKPGKARPTLPNGTVTGRCVKIAQASEPKLTAATQARIIALADAQMKQVAALPWHKRVFTMKNMIMATVAVLGAAAAVIYFNRWRQVGLQGYEKVFKYYRNWKWRGSNMPQPNVSLRNVNAAQQAAQSKLKNLAGTMKDPRLSDSKNVRTFFAAVKSIMSQEIAPSAKDMAKLKSHADGLVAKGKWPTNIKVGKFLQEICKLDNGGQCYHMLNRY